MRHQVPNTLCNFIAKIFLIASACVAIKIFIVTRNFFFVYDDLKLKCVESLTYGGDYNTSLSLRTYSL